MNGKASPISAFLGPGEEAGCDLPEEKLTSLQGQSLPFEGLLDLTVLLESPGSSDIFLFPLDLHLLLVHEQPYSLKKINLRVGGIAQ